MIRALLRDSSQHILLAAVAAYRRLLSPHFGPSCRFIPSCSAYADEAIRRAGPWRGARLAAGRLLRCHPWGAFGYDPVPDSSPTPTGRRG